MTHKLLSDPSALPTALTADELLEKAAAMLSRMADDAPQWRTALQHAASQVRALKSPHPLNVQDGVVVPREPTRKMVEAAYYGRVNRGNGARDMLDVYADIYHDMISAAPAQPAQDALATGDRDECPTCGGTREIDWTLVGIRTSDPRAPCPDCVPLSKAQPAQEREKDGERVPIWDGDCNFPHAFTPNDRNDADYICMCGRLDNDPLHAAIAAGEKR